MTLKKESQAHRDTGNTEYYKKSNEKNISTTSRQRQYKHNAQTKTYNIHIIVSQTHIGQTMGNTQ